MKDFLRFEDVSDQYPTRKTKTFDVYSTHTNERLGTIEWFSDWRTYVFSPEMGAFVFSLDCLTELTLFINELLNERIRQKNAMVKA